MPRARTTKTSTTAATPQRRRERLFIWFCLRTASPSSSSASSSPPSHGMSTHSPQAQLLKSSKRLFWNPRPMPTLQAFPPSFAGKCSTGRIPSPRGHPPRDLTRTWLPPSCRSNPAATRAPSPAPAQWDSSKSCRITFAHPTIPTTPIPTPPADSPISSVRLETANGDARLAMAGYNGGIGIIPRGEWTWSAQTKRYVQYGAPIYSDAISGVNPAMP
jgi:hypothetical protein